MLHIDAVLSEHGIEDFELVKLRSANSGVWPGWA